MASEPDKNDLPTEGIMPVESETRALDGDGKPVRAINEDKLRRALSPRQVQMIAIGGTIGYVWLLL